MIKGKALSAVMSVVLLSAIGIDSNNIVEASGYTEEVVNVNYVKRIDFVDILSTLEKNKDSNIKLNFKDVDLNDYGDVLNVLVDVGSISNVDKFNPQNDLTVSQLSKIVYHYFNFKESKKRFKINDLDVSNPHYKYIESLLSEGIINLDKKGNVYPHRKINTVEFYSIIEKLFNKEMYVDENNLLRINYFDFLLNVEKLQNNSVYTNITYNVNTTKDMQNLIMMLEEDLPDKVVVNSNYFSTDKLKEMYYETKSWYSVKQLENFATLSNYSMKITKGKLNFVDNTKKGYRAVDVENAYNKFVEELSSNLMRENEYESLVSVYDYIFDNYIYNASSRQEMIVGNLGSGEVACNAFSRLSKDLLNRLGIETEIREGTSHYWNIVKLDGVETTFDVTTDIVKNERYLTLGNSTKEYIDNTSSIGFYSANYNNPSYNKVFSNDKIIKNK